MTILIGIKIIWVWVDYNNTNNNHSNNNSENNWGIFHGDQTEQLSAWQSVCLVYCGIKEAGNLTIRMLLLI